MVCVEATDEDSGSAAAAVALAADTVQETITHAANILRLMARTSRAATTLTRGTAMFRYIYARPAATPTVFI
jgi:hypothetical protein